MDYVRLDTKEQYMYLPNDMYIKESNEYRSMRLMKKRYRCNRITRKENIPDDVKPFRWYTKEKYKDIDPFCLEYKLTFTF